MTYTIEIWSCNRVKLPKSLPGTPHAHRWCQGEKAWALTITPPTRLNPDDIPPQIAEQRSGIQYLTEVCLQGQVPLRVVAYFHDLIRQLAQTSTGILVDRWSETCYALEQGQPFLRRFGDISMNAAAWFIEQFIPANYPGQYAGYLTLLPGTRSVLIGGYKVLFRWDIDTGIVEQLFNDATDMYRLSDVAALPDGRHVLLALEGNDVGIWDLQTRNLVHTLQGHTGYVHQVAALPDGRRLVSTSSDKTLRIWDTNTYETLHVLRGHQEGVNCVAVLPEGNRILSGSLDGFLGLWDVNTGECIRMWKAYNHPVSAVEVLPDGHHVFSGSREGSLLSWDLETAEIAFRFNGDYYSGIGALALLPDGQRLVSGGGYSLRLWHVEDPNPVDVFQIADLPPDFGRRRDVPSIVTIHRTNWMRDLAVLDEEHIIGSDNDGNLYVIQVLPR